MQEVMKPGRKDMMSFSNPASDDHELETLVSTLRRHLVEVIMLSTQL
jgi:hypothetical protein